MNLITKLRYKIAKRYVRRYMDAFGFRDESEVVCEICFALDDDRKPVEERGRPADEIHHIDARGMGGSKHRDHILNLMATCRQHHDDYGDKTQYKDFLRQLHRAYLNLRAKTELFIQLNTKSNEGT